MFREQPRHKMLQFMTGRKLAGRAEGAGGGGCCSEAWQEAAGCSELLLLETSCKMGPRCRHRGLRRPRAVAPICSPGRNRAQAVLPALWSPDVQTFRGNPSTPETRPGLRPARHTSQQANPAPSPPSLPGNLMAGSFHAS